MTGSRSRRLGRLHSAIQTIRAADIQRAFGLEALLAESPCKRIRADVEPEGATEVIAYQELVQLGQRPGAISFPIHAE